MDAFECIRKRRDIRSFVDREVPLEIALKIVDAGRLSPSARNLQPWHFILIRARETLVGLRSVCLSGRFVSEASFAVIVLTDRANKWHEIDGARAVQNMSLAAWNEGVGTCWVGSIARDEVRERFGVPERWQVFTILPFGYPEEFTVKTKKRRMPLGEVVSMETFGERLEGV